MGKRVIYVTYDGLEDQLGKSQVLPYVQGLAERGHEFEIVSFEKPGKPLCYRKRISANVRWTALRYHQTPSVPATAFDMAQGLGTVALRGLFSRADLVHVRSYVPCTLVLPWVEMCRVPLLFDMRGFWVDERVEGGRWSAKGRLYRTAKRIERTLLARSDTITMLTGWQQTYLRQDYAFASSIRGTLHVIPTCTDLGLFTPNVEADRDLARVLHGTKVLLYLGAISSYYLPREMAEFYLAWRKYASPARLLVVSRSDLKEIRDVLAAAGVGHELVHRTASREEVPAMVRCGHASFGLRSGQNLAGNGCAPTKMGEALACGLPFASSMIGDVPLILGPSPAGVCIPDERPVSLDAAARQLAEKAFAPGMARYARATAERWFSLTEGVDAYDAIYRGMPRRHGDAGALADTSWPPRGPSAGEA
jgi:glycosyltransferase involved in cell wall biosynthesis